MARKRKIKEKVALHPVMAFIVCIIGAIVIKFTKINVIDAIMSIGVAIFILIHAIKSFKSIVDLFLEKTPNGIEIEQLKEHLLEIENVKDVHHIHIWSLDGINNFATLHVVTDENKKKEIRYVMKEHGINNVTIEIEKTNEVCNSKCCKIEKSNHHHHHHH